MTGGEGRWTWRKVRAEARDDSISAVTRVSCQRAAAGMPKCAICDRVCHAIIPCTAATDDENMPERMTPRLPPAESTRRGVGVRQDTRLSFEDPPRAPEKHTVHGQ